jgi:hypothetical protein
VGLGHRLKGGRRVRPTVCTIDGGWLGWESLLHFEVREIVVRVWTTNVTQTLYSHRWISRWRRVVVLCKVNCERSWDDSFRLMLLMYPWKSLLMPLHLP